MQPHSAVLRAAATYDAASDAYDHPANSFWAHFGRETVERLNLQGGERVLDVCTGSGASAVPAALKVGPRGGVVCVDVAARLLGLAKQKANDAGLNNLDFICKDLMALEGSLGGFDVVVCVFGIFFLPDVSAALSHLWSFVKPGGRLAVTTWGPDFFEPANSIFWDSIRVERPELCRSFNPWDKLVTPQLLADAFEAAHIPAPHIEPVASMHSVPTPQDWWQAVLGSGYRGTLDQLTPEQRSRVRESNLSQVEARGITRVQANVVYAVAHRT